MKAAMMSASFLPECSSIRAVWSTERQVEELRRRSKGAMSKEAVVAFVPDPSDIIIASPPKCGTTWLVHICHQIRKRGASPDFVEQIPDVATWIEYSKKLFNIDPNTAVQSAVPRIFFTHLPYTNVPKGGKLIYCFRDQTDALYSFYVFINTMAALNDRVSLPIFADYFQKLQWTRKHFQDLLVWWEHRHDPDVLLLFYEDLRENHAGSARRIARFMGSDCGEDVIARIVHTTTHSEMVRHHSKFDMHSIAIANAKALGDEPPREFCGGVRKNGGKSGDGVRLLPSEVRQGIVSEWREIVTSKLGFRRLDDMREAWRVELSNAQPPCRAQSVYRAFTDTSP